MAYSCVFSFKLNGTTSENPDGAKRTRTADPLHAMQVLYQLSYGPISKNNSYINQSEGFFRNCRNSYSTLLSLVNGFCTLKCT